MSDNDMNSIPVVKADENQTSNKTVLRAVTFGGFNRNDVLEFIEKQKQVEANLKERIKNLSSQLEEAKNSAADAASAVDAEELEECRRDAAEKASALAISKARLSAAQEKNDALEAELNELRAAIEEKGEIPGAMSEQEAGELRAQLDAAIKEKEALAQELSDSADAVKNASAQSEELIAGYDKSMAEKDAAIAEMAARLSAQEDALKAKDAEIAQLKADLSKAQDAARPESQVAAAIIDARRCADEIIASAKVEERKIRDNTYSEVLKAQQMIQNICNEMDISLERCKRNADMAKTTMSDLQKSIADDAEALRMKDSGESIE